MISELFTNLIDAGNALRDSVCPLRQPNAQHAYQNGLRLAWRLLTVPFPPAWVYYATKRDWTDRDYHHEWKG